MTKSFIYMPREYGDIYRIAIDEEIQDMIYVYYNIFIPSTFCNKIYNTEEIPTNILNIIKEM